MRENFIACLDAVLPIFVLILVGYVRQRADMFLGDHQYVHGSLWFQIVEADQLVVFINRVRRNLVGSDGAEYAVVQHKITPFIPS